MTSLAQRLAAALIVMVTAAAAVLTSAALTAPARAETLELTPTVLLDGYVLEYDTDEGRLVEGAVAIDGEGRKYYCIESDAPVDYEVTGTIPLPEDEVSARLAWLMTKYEDSLDPTVHASIARIAELRYKLNESSQNPVSLSQSLHSNAVTIHTADSVLPISDTSLDSRISTRVDELWEESARLAPLEIRVEQAAGEDSFSGSVRVLVVNALGEPVDAVPYEVSLDGPASFGGGSSVVTGVSTTDWTEHAWTAAAAGTVTVEASFSRGRVERAVSSQDFVRLGSPSVASDVGVFFVRKDFVPSLETRVPARVLDEGSTVEDEVRADVVENPAGWVAGLELEAEGWYFEGIPFGMLDEGVSPDSDETAPEFLARLEGRGFVPVGYGRASFASAGQSVTVQAVTEPGGATPYRTSGVGLGTWVWAFSRESLSDTAEDFVLADVVTPFLETSETVSVRARPTVESSVTEHEVRVGAEIEDVITVSGFPDDHGFFEGDEAWGLAADDPVARVSVWWAGDADDPSAMNPFRPDGPDVPQEDEHHRLVGAWEYPAGNGELRVGGGNPDARGVPVHILAEDPGWYVFVWSFAGDDRVMPSSSAYDDPWERVRVVPANAPDSPAISIVTTVDPERVRVNQPFRDVARVTGLVPAGSTVEFTAFEAVGHGEMPDADTGRLLDASHAPIECSGVTESDGEGAAGDGNDREDSICLARSPDVRSPSAGLVFWKAAVVSAAGDILASHELGAPGEVVTVTVVPDVALPLTGAGSVWRHVLVASVVLALAIALLLLRRMVSHHRRC